MDPYQDGNENVLAPLADMFNYNPNSVKTDWSFIKDNFVVSATEDIKKGEEINVQYGEHDNKHFFIN